MGISRLLVRILAALAIVGAAACAKENTPTSPTPPLPVDPPIANAYILPGAVDMGSNAFGDEPVVIFKGELLHWTNLDLVAHDIVADVKALPEFQTTGTLEPGDERWYHMNTVGMTKIHCTIHPQMVGILAVRER